MISGIRRFWHRVFHWEYWPFNVLYFPVYFYYAYLALKYRSLFFFTAANPKIDFGGMLGEKKSSIYKLIPQQYLPKYQLVQTGDLEVARSFSTNTGWPLICKPDIGERGNMVEIIRTDDELEKYVAKCPVPFLIQELVDYPVELGVFFIRIPGCSQGQITSIVQKDFLHVIGNGLHTVEELLKKNARANLQLDFQHPRFAHVLQKIPKINECVVVESIGNHCRGTMFLDMTHQATQKLQDAFNELTAQIDGFYFGRFDLRCKSFECLETLSEFKILELNGAGSEPGHIYQPGYPLWKGYKDILWHLKQLGKVSQLNHKSGVKYWTFKQGIAKMRTIKAYNKIAQD